MHDVTWASAGWFSLQVLLAFLATAVLFVITLPTRLGSKLLAFHFDQKLETFKGLQNEKIEELRDKLSHLGDRGKRSNELEYKAISEAWEKFVDAFLATNSSVIMYLQYPDLDRLSSEEVETFLSSTDLSEGQRKAVISASEKNRSFSQMMSYRAAGVAGQEIFQARLLLRKNGIFIPGDLKERFEEALSLCSDAQVQRAMENQHGDRIGLDLTASQKFLAEGIRVFEDLMTTTRERLLREIEPRRQASRDPASG